MGSISVAWGDFAVDAPNIASFAAERFAGRVAYLATIRPDGGPRVHPVTPIIGGGHLFVFMEPTSPKGQDLQRNTQYALHCGVEDTGGGAGEVFVHGHATFVNAEDLRAVAIAASSYTPKAHYILFELLVGRAGATIYTADETVRHRWQAQ